MSFPDYPELNDVDLSDLPMPLYHPPSSRPTLDHTDDLEKCARICWERGEDVAASVGFALCLNKVGYMLEPRHISKCVDTVYWPVPVVGVIYNVQSLLV